MPPLLHFSFFFFNDTATTEIYTLSLHDALPILNSILKKAAQSKRWQGIFTVTEEDLVSRDILGNPHASIADLAFTRDRKSTRLNSSHQIISYAVFCLKKKKILRLFLYCWISYTC